MRATSSSILLAISLLLLSGLTGCTDLDNAQSERPFAQVAPPVDKIAAKASRSPLTQRQLPTTDGTIAIENLNAQIAGTERAMEKSWSGSKASSLALLLLSRAQ